MDFEKYLRKENDIYQSILEYIDNSEDSEINFSNFEQIINDHSIKENKEELDSIFRLLNSIANNHHRSSDFFCKIERIIKLFQSEMDKFFTNSEIFHIFKSNKRILLFLIEEGIIDLDESISFTLSNGWYKKCQYHFYFFPEIKKFLNEKQLEKMSNKTGEMAEINSNNFEENRKNGENHNYLCKLIQKDEIDDFIVYVNKTNLRISEPIEKSIYETNSFLLNKETSLIEYAAFYGSIQIFRYLYMNKVNVSPLIWFYSIHGRNPNIIHLIEEYHIKPIDETFSECFHESIKCHHNEIANYIQNNLMNKQEKSSIGIKYYNFEYFPNEQMDEFAFYFACKYNNVFIVEFILNNVKININSIFTDGNVQQTALIAAVKERNKEIVQLLLSNQNIDVNINSFLLVENIDDEKRISYKKDKSALHIAVCENDEEFVKFLLSNPNIDVNAKLDYYDKSSYSMHHTEKTALSIAVEKENAKIVSLLLNHPKIDVNQISRHNDGDYGVDGNHDRYIEKIPLIIAVEKENIEIVSLLLNHPEINVNIQSRYHDYKYVENLGYRGNQYKEKTALSIAVEKNNVEIVKLLLSNSKIELNYRLLFYNSNHDDADEDNYKTDSYIYDNDYDGDNFDELKIEDIRKYDSAQPHLFEFNEIKPKMIFSRSFIKEIKTPLFISVENKNIAIVDLLLNCKNIDVSLTSIIKSVKISDEITPLHEAIKNGNVDIIQLLKNHDAADLKKNYRDELDLII